MRAELSHWFWYEKFSVLLLKECPLIEFMPTERKQKISDLLKQISYEIAGGLRHSVSEANSVTNTPQNVETIDLDAIQNLKKLEL